MSSLFSVDWNWRFWRLDPCANCGKNTWRRDWVFAKKTRGRARYECFYCGNDLYPGGAVNQTLEAAIRGNGTELGASSSGSGGRNITDDDQG